VKKIQTSRPISTTAARIRPELAYSLKGRTMI
jgi:hypothetical protein